MNLSSGSTPLRSFNSQLSRLHINVQRRGIRSSPRRKVDRPTDLPEHYKKIWIFSNFQNGMTVYSHSPVLKANKALRQLPFVGKKLKPAKLRKDYWRPLAMVQFPDETSHEVGRSVFHIMREFRHRHDVAWDDGMLRDAETGRTLTRHERGERLNRAQKPNAIADLAAVLAGTGKGNHMVWKRDEEGKGKREAADEDGSWVDEGTGLVKATVFWADELDKNYAKEWSGNVTHSSFAEAMAVPMETEDGRVIEEGGESVSRAALPEIQVTTDAPQQERTLNG